MWSVRRHAASVMFQCQTVNGSVVYDNATEANPGDVGLISEATTKKFKETSDDLTESR